MPPAAVKTPDPLTSSLTPPSEFSLEQAGQNARRVADIVTRRKQVKGLIYEAITRVGVAFPVYESSGLLARYKSSLELPRRADEFIELCCNHHAYFDRSVYPEKKKVAIALLTAAIRFYHAGLVGEDASLNRAMKIATFIRQSDLKSHSVVGDQRTGYTFRGL